MLYLTCMDAHLITQIANIALTISVLVAVVFGIAQVKSAERDRKERMTLDILRSFQTKEFAEMLRHTAFATIPTTREEWLTRCVDDQVRFIQFTQQMENMGILLAERLINIDLVDKTLGAYVVQMWEKCKPLILDIRENNDDPFLSEYFQWMAEQIDRRMKERPRKPFHQSSRTAI